MSEISALIEDIKSISTVTSIVITDENGTPVDFQGVDEDDEKAAVTAFLGSGVNSIAGILDLDSFQSMTMSHENGGMIICPIGDYYLGVIVSESKQLFKIELKINEILN